jgi:hypothetical protein
MNTDIKLLEESIMKHIHLLYLAKYNKQLQKKVNKLFPLPKEENEPKEEDENVKLVIHD